MWAGWAPGASGPNTVPTDIVTLARLLRRGGWRAFDVASLRHRGARPPLCRLRSGRRASAPHMRGVEPPAGDARGLRQPDARSREGRKAFLRRRGAPRPVLPGRRMVPGLKLKGSGSEQRHLGHAEPAGMPGWRQRMHPAQWRRHHHPPELRQCRGLGDFGC